MKEGKELLLRRIDELEKELGLAEQTVRALAAGEIDTLIQPNTATPVLLLAAQEKLLSSEKLLRAVFEGATDAILIADDAGRYCDANPAACALFGLPLAELTGRRIEEFAVPEAAPHTGIWKAFLDAGRMSGEFPLLRPDGARRVLEYNAVANVLPGLHLSVLRDVTDVRAAERARGKAEAELRQSEARFRAMTEKSMDGIWLLDANVRSVYQSPAVERLLGYTLEEAKQLAWQDFVSADDLPRLKPILDELMSRPSATISLDFQIRHRQGGFRWLELSATNLLHDPDIGALVANFRDITERSWPKRRRQRAGGC